MLIKMLFSKTFYDSREGNSVTTSVQENVFFLLRKRKEHDKIIKLKSIPKTKVKLPRPVGRHQSDWETEYWNTDNFSVHAPIFFSPMLPLHNLIEFDARWFLKKCNKIICWFVHYEEQNIFIFKWFFFLRRSSIFNFSRRFSIHNNFSPTWTEKQ